MCRKDLLLRTEQDVTFRPCLVIYKRDGFQPQIHFEPII